LETLNNHIVVIAMVQQCIGIGKKPLKQIVLQNNLAANI